MEKVDLIEKNYKDAVSGINTTWLTEPSLEWYNYITHLPKYPQMVYTLMVFDNQVFNGGFHQYFYNTFGQFAVETIDFLIEIKAFNKSRLLKKALDATSVGYENLESFRLDILKRRVRAMFENQSLIELLEEVNEEYDNDDSEDITDLLEPYLADNISQ